MRYRPLGKTGLEVSEIGFGGWAIGGEMEARGTPIGFPNVSEAEALGAIRKARDLGVTFFDSADIYGYGRSESLIGMALSRNRSSVVLATKVGAVRTAGGDFRTDFSKQHIFAAVDGSLRRLRTDCIDLYQAHNPPMAVLRSEEIQEAMEMLQERGKIRFWGISIATPEDGLEIVRRGWGYTLQVLYNVLNQAPAGELLPLAKEKGFGIIARVPLASGLLTGKYRSDTVFPPNDVRQNFLTPRRLSEVVERVDEVRGILGGSVRTLAEGALRFVLEHDAVSTCIPGARSAHQVELNVAASAASLPADVVHRLRERLGDYNFYQRHAIPV